MGTLAPIFRLQNWWSKLGHVDINKCAARGCKHHGPTFLSDGGYRYCSEACETADAEEQADTF